jgi:hypothetical protein
MGNFLLTHDWSVREKLLELGYKLVQDLPGRYVFDLDGKEPPDFGGFVITNRLVF